jgi:hypothetical protein
MWLGAKNVKIINLLVDARISLALASMAFTGQGNEK